MRVRGSLESLILSSFGCQRFLPRCLVDHTPDCASNLVTVVMWCTLGHSSSPRFGVPAASATLTPAYMVMGGHAGVAGCHQNQDQAHVSLPCLVLDELGARAKREMTNPQSPRQGPRAQPLVTLVGVVLTGVDHILPWDRGRRNRSKHERSAHCPIFSSELCRIHFRLIQSGSVVLRDPWPLLTGTG